jgi:hypothetical protein
MALDVRSRCAIEVPDNNYNTIRLDLGDHGWRHPDLCYYVTSKTYMKECCERDGVDPAEAYPFDTRLTVEEVIKKVREKESETWDEYISLATDFKYDANRSPKEKWPSDCRCAVYVVTGGSEGLYLHVDLVKEGGKHELMILGKSLGHSWEECWLSAARIAAMLNA